jgi:hypothetical protein
MIDKVAAIIQTWGKRELTEKLAIRTCERLAEAIQKLYEEEGYVQKWKVCKYCKGTGRRKTDSVFMNGNHPTIPCGFCNGTGHVPRYVELAENQEVPKNYHLKVGETFGSEKAQGYQESIYDFTTPHAENGITTKWVKVIELVAKLDREKETY